MCKNWKYTSWKEKLLDVLMFLIVLVVVAAVFYPFAYRAEAKQRCLQAGFPEIRMDWQLNRYCVGQKNGFSNVVPVKYADISPFMLVEGDQ